MSLVYLPRVTPQVPPFDLGRAIVYTFEDPRDRGKIALACALFFVGALTAGCLVGLLPLAILLGYQRRVALAVAAGTDSPLPEMDRWGDDLREGLKMLVIRMLYGLPGAFFLVGGYFLFFFAVMTSRNGEPHPAAILAFLLGFVLGMPLMMLGQLLGALAVIRYVESGDLSTAFRPRELYRFARENLGSLLLTLVTSIAAGIAAYVVGLLLLIIGAYFTPGWTYLATGHAYGQVIRQHRIRRTSAAAEAFT